MNSAATLIERLAAGWTPAHSIAALECVRLWGERLEAATEVKDVGADALHFVTDLSEIHLRGMDEIHCLLLAGSRDDLKKTVEEFWLGASIPGRLIVVLALSETAHAKAQSALADLDAVVLSRSEVQALLEDARPRKFFKTELCRRLPPRSLIPYSILLSAQGGMFYGRDCELARLREEVDVSFAIAGPSRIGKTSLVKRHQKELARLRHPGALATFYVDCYACPNTPDAIARTIAMEIDGSSRSARMKLDDLMNFLRFQSRVRLGRPVELILDEVDEVCQSSVMVVLAKAARLGICRLILCGRGALLHTMLNQNSLLASRLELLRLEPLDEQAARRLVFEPLIDFGLRVEEADRLAEAVFGLTGRLPHLLQYYGRRLLELAIQQRSETVSSRDIETLQWDYEAAQYFTSPLADLKDPRSRLVAFSILNASGGQLTVAAVQELAVREGLRDLHHAEAFHICNDLVINNILAWEKGSFRVANEALRYYAGQLRFLDRVLEEARRELAIQ
jgi:hypothetical protein